MSEEQNQHKQAKETLKEAAINLAVSKVEHRFALDKYKILVNQIMGVQQEPAQPKELIPDVTERKRPGPIEMSEEGKKTVTPPPIPASEQQPEPKEKVDEAIDEIKSEGVELPGKSSDYNIDEAVEMMQNATDEQRLEFTHGDGRKGIGYHMRVKWDLEVQGLDEDSEEDSQEEEKEEPKEEKKEEPKSPPPPAPSKPEAPKAPEKPSAPTPPPSPAKSEEPADESPEPPAEEKSEDKPQSGNQKVELPEGIVRPEGSPECFGNSDVYDETSKKCMTCIYDFECKEAIEEMEG